MSLSIKCIGFSQPVWILYNIKCDGLLVKQVIVTMTEISAQFCHQDISVEN